MKTMKCQLLLALLAFIRADHVALDGSGTTNPSKLLWKVFSTFQDRSRRQLQLTYRAVGSSTGQYEFLGLGDKNGKKNPNYDRSSAPNITFPDNYNDFGAGDIPISNVHWNGLRTSAALGCQKLGSSQVGARCMSTSTSPIIQIPFVTGAISVFVNIPELKAANGGKGVGLNVTGCDLIKIFRRLPGGRNWNEINPAQNPLLRNVRRPIKVFHRVHGSSSTSVFLQYLGLISRTDSQCRNSYPARWVKKSLKDPTDSSCTCNGGSTCTSSCWAAGTFPGQGSGGMSRGIAGTAYSIGYIDAGHGHDLGFTEVHLKNRDGNYITSNQIGLGGISAAIDAATRTRVDSNGNIVSSGGSLMIPTAADGDFSKVKLLNLAGPNTWPVTAVSYIYAKKDLTAWKEEKCQLFKTFLNFLTSTAGGSGEHVADATSTNNDVQKAGGWAAGFHFAAIPPSVQTLANNGINMIQCVAPTASTAGNMIVDGKRKKWSLESHSKTRKGGGQGKYVLSAKRTIWFGSTEYSQIQNSREVSDAKTNDAAGKISEKAHDAEYQGLTRRVTTLETGHTTDEQEHEREYQALLAKVVALEGNKPAKADMMMPLIVGIVACVLGLFAHYRISTMPAGVAIFRKEGDIEITMQGREFPEVQS